MSAHRPHIFTPPLLPGGGRRAAGDTRHLSLLRALLFIPLPIACGIFAIVGVAAGSFAAGCVVVASWCIRTYDNLVRPDGASWRFSDLLSRRAEKDLEREVFDLRRKADVIPLHGKPHKSVRSRNGPGKIANDTGRGDAA